MLVVDKIGNYIENNKGKDKEFGIIHVRMMHWKSMLVK